MPFDFDQRAAKTLTSDLVAKAHSKIKPVSFFDRNKTEQKDRKPIRPSGPKKSTKSFRGGPTLTHVLLQTATVNNSGTSGPPKAEFTPAYRLRARQAAQQKQPEKPKLPRKGNYKWGSFRTAPQRTPRRASVVTEIEKSFSVRKPLLEDEDEDEETFDDEEEQSVLERLEKEFASLHM